MTVSAGIESPPADLITLGSRPPLTGYLRDVWRRRHFAYALADNDMRAKHMASFLGQLWHLINPAMMIAVYFLIFGVILSARRGVDHYVTFLVVGVLIFRFSQNTIVGCCKCIPQNLGLIRTVQFPRALVPLAVVLEQLMTLVPALGLIAVVAVVDGVQFGPQIVLLPVVILLGAAFSLGVGMAGARVGAVVADVQQILPHFFRIMLYMSGVLFSVRDSIEDPLFHKLFTVNPFYDLVQLTRWTVIGQHADRYVVIGLVTWAVVGLIAGADWFRRGEHKFGA